MKGGPTVDDAQLGQIETSLIDIYMPGVTKQNRKALRKLCKEKGIKIFSTDLQGALTNLLASIIRHRDTNYDSMCAAIGKKRARFYVQPIISQSLGG